MPHFHLSQGHRSAECSQPRQGGGARAGGGGNCFNCGQPGHRSAECSQPRQGGGGGGGGGSRACYSCGQEVRFLYDALSHNPQLCELAAVMRVAPPRPSSYELLAATSVLSPPPPLLVQGHRSFECPTKTGGGGGGRGGERERSRERR